MKETEITVQVFEDFDTIKSKLVGQGYAIVEEVIMKDYYFSKYPMEELKEFEYKKIMKNSFLVRCVESENERDLKVVYKDKEVDENNNVISEQKYSCKIADPDTMIKIFQCANLTCWCEVKQTMYEFNNGVTHFALQDVEGLGLFIEYEEDESMDGLSEYEKIEVLLNRLRALDLKIGDDYSCKKVLMKFNQQKNCQHNDLSSPSL